MHSSIAVTVTLGTISMFYIWYENRKNKQKSDRLLREGWYLKPLDANYSVNAAYACQSVDYKGWILPGNLIEFKDNFFNFITRPDDIYVVTFPKSGTTWMQEICYLIVNDVNLSKANLLTLSDRSPFLEFSSKYLEIGEKLESPRVLKSHLPYELLPTDVKKKKSKIIYICRNPKDVIVSFYHFYKNLLMVQYNGTFQNFWEKFMKDDLLYCPYWKHVLAYWRLRNEPNICFLKYEDMIKDITSVVQTVAKFIGKSLSDEQIKKIVNHTSFSKMKDNKKVNMDEFMRHQGSFIRKGEIGDWKNNFTIAMNDITDSWIKENSSETELVFTYE